MKKRRRFLTGAILLAAGVSITLVMLGQYGSEQPRCVPLEVSHETTRIVAPRTEQGRIDYIAALNAVEVPDAEENAAIPLLRILGTDILVGDVSAVLARLGAQAEIPAAGTFVPAPGYYPYQHGYADLEEPDERTAVVGWIAANRKALDAFVSASRRPRLWWPVVRDPASGALELALPADRLGNLAEALATRADIRWAKGDVRDGWTDVDALLHLHCLVDQLPGSLSRVVASSIRRKALDWLTNAFESSPPSEELCADMLRVLVSLPSPRSPALDIDVFDRYFALDAYIHIVGREIEEASGDPASHPANFHLNLALREINRAIDETVPLLRELDTEHVEQLTRLSDDRRERVKALGRELQQPPGQLRHLIQIMSTGGEHVGRLIGEILAEQVLCVVPIVVRSIHEGELRRRVVTLAAALRIHVLRNGAFPDTLGALVPATLVSIPRHPLDGGAIPYRRTDRGCRVGDEEWAIELGR